MATSLSSRLVLTTLTMAFANLPTLVPISIRSLAQESWVKSNIPPNLRTLVLLAPSEGGVSNPFTTDKVIMAIVRVDVEETDACY